jgi:hypothetical protein
MKTIPLAALPSFIQEAVQKGHTVETVVRKGKKIVARLSYRAERPSKSEVRIPCLIVPTSPFHRG